MLKFSQTSCYLVSNGQGIFRKQMLCKNPTKRHMHIFQHLVVTLSNQIICSLLVLKVQHFATCSDDCTSNSCTFSRAPACNVISQTPSGRFTMVIPHQHRNCSFSIIYPVVIKISDLILGHLNGLFLKVSCLFPKKLLPYADFLGMGEGKGWSWGSLWHWLLRHVRSGPCARMLRALVSTQRWYLGLPLLLLSL